MIDTKNKIVYLGYGDVTIFTKPFSIEFMEMKYVREPGTNLPNLIAIGKIRKTVVIKFNNLREVQHFIKLVKEIDETNFTSFEYYDYIFDFSNYNIKSIEAILKYLNLIEAQFVIEKGDILHI